MATSRPSHALRNNKRLLRADARPLEFLGDPRFLIALTVLLVNDHWAKAAFHNSVTGKLSDFAGLFVAGALVASLAHLRPAAKRGQRDRTQVASLTFLALWFTSFKISATAATATVWLADAILPWDNAIVADPTDLISLPMVWLGAAACNRPIVWMTRDRSQKLALGVALVACTATSNEDPDQITTFVELNSNGDVIVVDQGDLRRRNELGEIRQVGATAALLNPDEAGDGLELSDEEALKFAEDASAELFACSADGPDQLCARIIDGEKIQEQRPANGPEWQTVWSFDRTSPMLTDGWGRTETLHDSAVAADGSVAASFQLGGMIRRTSDGTWSGGDRFDREMPHAISQAIVLGAIVPWAVLLGSQRRWDVALGKRRSWLRTVVALGIALGVVGLIISVYGDNSAVILAEVILVLFSGPFLLLANLIKILDLIKLGTRLRVLAVAALVAGLVTALLSTVPLQLWTAGTLPRYWVAAWLGLGIGAAGTVAGCALGYRLTSPPDQPQVRPAHSLPMTPTMKPVSMR